MNNDVLVQKIKAIYTGDEKAFEELYTELKTPIFTVIFRITWNEDISEDILQETFFKLFTSPINPSSIKNPRAYIFKMARNLSIDHIRTNPQDISLDEISETATSQDDLSLHIDIEDALKCLSSQECEIVTLHIIGGFKFREIAGILEAPSGTVKWRYHKALKTLRKLMTGGKSS